MNGFCEKISLFVLTSAIISWELTYVKPNPIPISQSGQESLTIEEILDEKDVIKEIIEMARKISAEGLAILKQYEGLRLDAYKGPDGVLTIGYGITNASGVYRVTENSRITEETANYLLKKALEQYEEAVDTQVTVPLTDSQFSALVSFVYNIGPTAFVKSTLLKKLNAGDYASVPSELHKWIYIKGKAVDGLKNRRAAESGLWAKGEFVSSSYMTPDSDNKALISHPEFVAPGLGAAAGLGGIMTGSGPIQWAFAIVILASFGFLVWMNREKIMAGRK